MSDPRRWKDDPGASPAVRDLLRSARPTAAPAPDQLQALQSEVARIASTPAPTGWLAAKPFVYAGAGLVAAGAGAALVLKLTATPMPPAPIEPPPPVPAPIAEAPVSQPSVTPTPPAPVAQRRPPRTAPRDTLAEETRLLDAARDSLASDTAGALQLLEQHARRFPKGQLAPEREVFLIDALGRLQRRSEQRAHAEAFLARWPKSPYAKRVRTTIEARE